jgi:hypothetical protein
MVYDPPVFRQISVDASVAGTINPCNAWDTSIRICLSGSHNNTPITHESPPTTMSTLQD